MSNNKVVLTDSKNQEIKLGDYIFISEFSPSVEDRRVPKTMVLKINATHKAPTLSVYYSCGWPNGAYGEGYEVKGKFGWWISYAQAIVKIPQRLVDARDKKSIQLFVKLAGFDVDLDNIEFYEDE